MGGKDDKICEAAMSLEAHNKSGLEIAAGHGHFVILRFSGLNAMADAHFKDHDQRYKGRYLGNSKRNLCHRRRYCADTGRDCSSATPATTKCELVKRLWFRFGEISG